TTSLTRPLVAGCGQQDWQSDNVSRENEPYMTHELARVVHAARTPHRYTLATWSTGVLCIDKYGLPDLGGVLLFVSGATTAFGVILWTVRNRQASVPAPRVPLAGVHIGALSASTLTTWTVAAS